MLIWCTCEKKSEFKRDVAVGVLDRAQSEKPDLRNNTPRKCSEEENQNYSPEKLVQLAPQLLLQPKSIHNSGVFKMKTQQMFSV